MQHQKDDIAFACFMTSQYYQENPQNQEYIQRILNRLGQVPFQTGTEVVRIYQTYQIQHGISKLVLRAKDEFSRGTPGAYEIKSTNSCHFIYVMSLDLFLIDCCFSNPMYSIIGVSIPCLDDDWIFVLCACIILYDSSVACQNIHIYMSFLSSSIWYFPLQRNHG